MKGYAELEVFTTFDLHALREAKKIVRCFPTKDQQGRWVRCHEVARVVGALLALQVQDGWYGMVEHSWLWLRPRTGLHEPQPSILDTYAVGRMPVVQLVDSRVPGTWEYRCGDKRRDVRPSVLELLYQRVRARL